MPACRHESLTIGAVGQCGHQAEVRPDESIEPRVTLPLQVMPLPVPALGRALVEQLFDPRHVACQPFSARECDVAEVELRFGLPPGFGLIDPSELRVLVSLSLS